jgi:prefoldin beta subunit
MTMSKETEKNIAELQQLEQNLSTFLMQKQTFQTQLMEIENALNEIEKSKDKIYKIVGPLMIESNKVNMKKDLSEKKEMLDLRVKSIDKQETKIKERAESLQKEVMKELKQ